MSLVFHQHQEDLNHCGAPTGNGAAADRARLGEAVMRITKGLETGIASVEDGARPLAHARSVPRVLLAEFAGTAMLLAAKRGGVRALAIRWRCCRRLARVHVGRLAGERV